MFIHLNQSKNWENWTIIDKVVRFRTWGDNKLKVAKSVALPGEKNRNRSKCVRVV